MLRSLVLLQVVTVPLAAAPVPKSIKPKASGLDGRWEIVELWSGMAEVSKLNPWVWDITGESLTILIKEGGTLKEHDPSTKTTLIRPEKGGADDIDYIRDEGGVPKLFPGTVVVNGDELVICFNGPNNPRPAERKPFQSGWYYKFKRIADK